MEIYNSGDERIVEICFIPLFFLKKKQKGETENDGTVYVDLPQVFFHDQISLSRKKRSMFFTKQKPRIVFLIM